MKYDFYILDVFSSASFGGNQLAVLPEASGISVSGMQKIAREFNFSETTFVFPPKDNKATARVRIFTPQNEMDFAGHPTIGTACALVFGNHVKTKEITLEENIGLIRVSVEADGDFLKGTLSNETPLVQPEEAPNLDALADVLSVDSEDVIEAFYAGVGIDFCYVRLRSREAVDKCQINRAALVEFDKNAWSSILFFFAGDIEEGSELYARMVAPLMGVDEDPATGSAVAALVGIAASRRELKDGTIQMSVIQGAKMGRISHMQANAICKNGSLVSVGVGGPAVVTATGKIEVSKEWLDTP